MSKRFVSLSAISGTYRVTFLDGDPVEVEVIGADVMRWEQVNQKSFFASDPSLSRIAWVVWAAMRRQRLTDLEVSAFIASVADLEQGRDTTGEDDEDEEGVALPDPTEADITAL